MLTSQNTNHNHSTDRISAKTVMFNVVAPHSIDEKDPPPSVTINTNNDNIDPTVAEAKRVSADEANISNHNYTEIGGNSSDDVILV